VSPKIHIFTKSSNTNSLSTFKTQSSGLMQNVSQNFTSISIVLFTDSKVSITV